jgi:hypothetical protein
MELGSCHPTYIWNSEMANTFLENLCAPCIDTVMLKGPIMGIEKHQKVDLIYSLISKIEVR